MNCDKDAQLRTKRVTIDCRDFPNEIGCTLLISGNIKEVFNISLKHAVTEHGHKNTPELRKQLKLMMKPETENRKKLNNVKKIKKENKYNEQPARN